MYHFIMSANKEKQVKTGKTSVWTIDWKFVPTDSSISLSTMDSTRFAEALLNPPAPNKRLKQAAVQHKVLIVSR